MGLVQAIGGIAGGILSSNSASDAADAQVAAAQAQAEVEKYIYDDTKQRFAPYYNSGLDFQNALRYELLGGGRPLIGAKRYRINEVTEPGKTQYNVPMTGDENGNHWGSVSRHKGMTQTPGTTRYEVGGQTFDTREEAEQWRRENRGGHRYKGFEATPGYQFALEQGQAAIDGSAAARGNVFSGATLKAQQEFGTGLAQQEYGNYLNRLTGQAAQGQAAAGNIATAGSNYASGMGNVNANIGNAQAAGAIGQGNALTSGLNSIIEGFGYMSTPAKTASNGVSVPNALMQQVNGLF